VPLVIIDGTPGIGCPVIASITGVDYAVIVTEPTISGFHDLKRVGELVKQFGIKAGCIINKTGLNEEVSVQIKSYLEKNNIDLICELPYDNVFTKAATSGLTVMESNSGKEIETKLTESWMKIREIIN